MTNSNRALAARVLEIVDCGLNAGLQSSPNGHMCVQQAVREAMGLFDSGDRPPGVDELLCDLLISLNDLHWGSAHQRACGMRRLALVQLGSKGLVQRPVLIQRLELLPRALLPGILERFVTRRVLKNISVLALSAPQQAELEHFWHHLQRLGQSKELQEILQFSHNVERLTDALALPPGDRSRLFHERALLVHLLCCIGGSESQIGVKPEKALEKIFGIFGNFREDDLPALSEAIVQLLIDLGLPGATLLDLSTGARQGRDSRLDQQGA